MYQFLVSEFNQLNKIVPNIHYGGCCKFAEALYKLLVNLGKTPKIYIITRDANYITLADNGENVDECYLSIAHAMIYLDGRYIDNTGAYISIADHKIFSPSHTAVSIKIDTLIHWNNTLRNWNDTFNRNHIPDMEDYLNKMFEKIQNNLVELN